MEYIDGRDKARDRVSPEAVPEDADSIPIDDVFLDERINGARRLVDDSLEDAFSSKAHLGREGGKTLVRQEGGIVEKAAPESIPVEKDDSILSLIDVDDQGRFPSRITGGEHQRRRPWGYIRRPVWEQTRQRVFEPK